MKNLQKKCIKKSVYNAGKTGLLYNVVLDEKFKFEGEVYVGREEQRIIKWFVSFMCVCVCVYMCMQTWLELTKKNGFCCCNIS